MEVATPMKAQENGTINDSPEYVIESEKDKGDVEGKEKELQQALSRNMELRKRVKDLEQQLAIWKQLGDLNKKPQGTKNQSNQSSKKPTGKQKSKSLTKAEKASKKPKTGTKHPVIPGKEETSDDSQAFYQAVSELCPDIKLSVILNAEKLFLEGDANGNGLIDVDELDTLFTKHLALYTRQQTEEILESIDTDSSHTLDFIEVLEVMHKLDIGAETNLPEKTVQKGPKGSPICLIQ